MFNLMKKDLIIQKSQLVVFVPIIIALAMFAKDFSPVFIFILASSFIPINAYIYDEQVESNILLNSLPYTRKEIVASRYIGAIVFMILSMSVVAGILYLFNFGYEIKDIAIAAGLYLIFVALAFPLFYILKPGYIGVVVLVGVVILAVLYRPVINFLSENLTSIIDFLTSLSATIIYLSSAGIVIVLYLISWMLSQIIYQRKVF